MNYTKEQLKQLPTVRQYLESELADDPELLNRWLNVIHKRSLSRPAICVFEFSPHQFLDLLPLAYANRTPRGNGTYSVPAMTTYHLEDLETEAP